MNIMLFAYVPALEARPFYKSLINLNYINPHFVNKRCLINIRVYLLVIQCTICKIILQIMYDMTMLYQPLNIIILHTPSGNFLKNDIHWNLM